MTLSVVVAGVVAMPTAQAAQSAPTVPAVSNLLAYPMPPRAVPEQLRPQAQQKLPMIGAKAVQIIGEAMDQTELMPVQVVSALHIRRAFRKQLGNAAWRSALRISWRESRLLPNVVNDTNTNGTNDWGLFQLNDGGTLQFAGGIPGQDVLAPQWNARAAARIVADVGWDPWGGML